jgi:hypothetical protein
VSGEYYRAVRTSPWFWEERAGVLRAAADATWEAYEASVAKYKHEAVRRGDSEENWIADIEDPAPRLYTVSYLLLGAGMETLLKGALIAAGDDDVERLGHNLPAIAQAAGMDLSARQVELLRKLQEAIQWRAKYPAPKFHVNRPDPEIGDELEPDDRLDVLKLYADCVEVYKDRLEQMRQDETDPDP